MKITREPEIVKKGSFFHRHGFKPGGFYYYATHGRSLGVGQTPQEAVRELRKDYVERIKTAADWREYFSRHPRVVPES